MVKWLRKWILKTFKGIGTNLTIYTINCNECKSKSYQVMEPENIFIICPVCSTSYLAERKHRKEWAGFKENKQLNLIPIVRT